MYSLVQQSSANLRRHRRGIMVAPSHGISRYRTGALVSPGSYDLDDEGLGELGFLKKVSSGAKKGLKKVGKVAKKAAPIVIPVAAVALAPFTGGASLAVGAAYTAYTARKGTGAMSTSQKVGAGILGAGAVGYGAYSYSQTGKIPGVETAKKVGSTVSNWFGSSGGAQQGAPQPAYPPQTAMGPPQIQSANPLWVQQQPRPPVVTYVSQGSYPPSSSQMRTQFSGGGFQQAQDPMQMYQEEKEGMSTNTMMAIGATVIGGLALVTLT